MSSSSSTFVPRGDFSTLKLGDWDREMIESAFKAVESVPGGWDFLRTYEPGDGGFMFSTPPPKMEEINAAVERFYGGHSGASYGMTMRVIEFIAKKGWEAYVAKVGVKPAPAPVSVGSVLQQAINTDRFINSLPANTDLRTFATAIQNDAGMRAQIPDIDEQVDGINRYIKAVDDAKKDPSSWKKSAGFPYPCPCRRAQGKEGWCGVAGFGVPACEH